MAIARLQIPKTTWAKIKTKLERAEHKETARELRTTRQSSPPGGGAVLWAPSTPLCDQLRVLLEREETFVRRKGTCSHQDLLTTIEKLKNFPAP
jgi:hypothetical protein